MLNAVRREGRLPTALLMRIAGTSQKSSAAVAIRPPGGPGGAPPTSGTNTQMS